MLDTNIQATESAIEKGDALPIMELFYTIQGEGVHAGKAAIFIRLAGCDVGCHWCDVKESWHAEKHPVLSIDKIVEECKKYTATMVVITGGEPLMYNLEKLTTLLVNQGFKTHIETSGAYAISGKWDWICVSPKKFKKALPNVLAKAHELKPIIFNKSDFKFAEENADLTSKECELLLQPEWSKISTMLPLIIEYVKQNPKWRVGLQTHKFMNIP